MPVIKLAVCRKPIHTVAFSAVDVNASAPRCFASGKQTVSDSRLFSYARSKSVLCGHSLSFGNPGRSRSTLLSSCFYSAVGHQKRLEKDRNVEVLSNNSSRTPGSRSSSSSESDELCSISTISSAGSPFLNLAYCSAAFRIWPVPRNDYQGECRLQLRPIYTHRVCIARKRHQ